ncbi:hypothetical protein [Methanobrevibacter curvatus]|uniref:Uncharacterized protein n=1 Tax=Methanobrevibacter curvatus TaxID=49547 RepID=A0A166E8U2_9EURY|nr:hypothetical protein [Methanobrevibacter curvatus]KZX16400.1 hypothetical protein MBCUR_00640 [Methanobrevibacter curvatus]
MSINDIFIDLNEIWKDIVKGLLIFIIFLIVAIDVLPDWSYIPGFIAAIGLLYVGYKSNNSIQAAVLAMLSSIPGFFVLYTTNSPDFQINQESIQIQALVLISLLLIGLICGFLGYIFRKRSDAALAEEAKKQENQTKPSKKDR